MAAVPRIWDPGGSRCLGRVVISVGGNWKLEQKEIKDLEPGRVSGLGYSVYSSEVREEVSV